MLTIYSFDKTSGLNSRFIRISPAPVIVGLIRSFPFFYLYYSTSAFLLQDLIKILKTAYK